MGGKGGEWVGMKWNGGEWHGTVGMVGNGGELVGMVGNCGEWRGIIGNVGNVGNGGCFFIDIPLSFRHTLFGIFVVVCCREYVSNK